MSVSPDHPLTPAAFQVLLALARGGAHGYAVMREVEEMTCGAVRLGPGTLYRTIGRLMADGLIEEVEAADPDAPHDARRRRYRVTDTGREAAAAEARLLARMVDRARDAGLLPSGNAEPAASRAVPAPVRARRRRGVEVLR